MNALVSAIRDYKRDFGVPPDILEIERWANFREPHALGRILTALQIAATASPAPTGTQAVAMTAKPDMGPVAERILDALFTAHRMDDDPDEEPVVVATRAEMRKTILGALA